MIGCAAMSRKQPQKAWTSYLPSLITRRTSAQLASVDTTTRQQREKLNNQLTDLAEKTIWVKVAPTSTRSDHSEKLLACACTVRVFTRAHLERNDLPPAMTHVHVNGESEATVDFWLRNIKRKSLKAPCTLRVVMCTACFTTAAPNPTFHSFDCESNKPSYSIR